MDPYRLGIEPKAKGIILHQVLEAFFTNNTTYAALSELDTETINTQLEQHLKTALAEYAKEKPFTLNPAFLSAYTKRIIQQLSGYIALEQTRPPFTVTAREARTQYAVNTLTIRGIIDRIDTLADGSHCIIDYKTGEASISHWFGDTIRDPQLPIYSLAFSQKVGAIVLAKIHDTTITQTGICDIEHDFHSVKAKYPKPHSSWDDVQSYWQTQIDAITQTYSQGSVKVNPISVTTVCSHCPYAGLCRIWEQELTI